MAVKSAPSRAFRKSFGNRRLEPLHECGEDAIFAGFGSAARKKRGAALPAIGAIRHAGYLRRWKSEDFSCARRCGGV